LAEQTTRIPIVGYLFLAASQNDPLVMAWRQGLRDLGYVDGQNIKLEFRSAQGQPERLPGLAEDLLKVNQMFSSPAMTSPHKPSGARHPPFPSSSR
jgi:putative ABC transport system substrate-binding protein